MHSESAPERRIALYKSNQQELSEEELNREGFVLRWHRGYLHSNRVLHFKLHKQYLPYLTFLPSLKNLSV